MPTPEEIRKENERLAKLSAEEKQRVYQAKAREALDEVFKTQTLSDEEKAAARARLDVRLKEIYDPRASVDFTDLEAKKMVKDIVVLVIPRNNDSKKQEEYDGRLAKSEAAITKAFKNRTVVTDEISNALKGAALLSPEFEKVTDAKKLQVMADLQAQIPVILNTEFKNEAAPGKPADEQKMAALDAAVKEALLRATGGRDEVNIKVNATAIAKNIFDRDKAMRAELTKFMKDNDVGSEPEKKTAAEKTAMRSLLQPTHPSVVHQPCRLPLQRMQTRWPKKP